MPAWQKVEPFLAKHKVSTVVSAQASLPFALSVAAVRGNISVDEFTEETVADPVIQAMIPKTKVHQDTELFSRSRTPMPGQVTVRTKDGREFTDEVLYPKGNPEQPDDRRRVQGQVHGHGRPGAGRGAERRALHAGRGTCEHCRRVGAGAALQPPIDRVGGEHTWE